MNSSVPPWRVTASAPSSKPVAFQPSATPAYIPVQARRSLSSNKPTYPPSNGSSTQPAMPPAAEAPRPRMEFPPAVRLYVQRCFAPENQVASVSHPEMQEKLRQVITEAAENNKLQLIDWERLALPQVMIQNERNRILANPNVSNWGMSSQPSSPSDPSRKRKSTDNSQQRQSGTDSPPWKKANNRNRFEDRVTHPSTEKKSRMTLDDSSKSKANLEMRRKRFEGAGVSYGTSGTSSPVDSPSSRSVDQDQGPVVGRCQTLEKNYFRLTSAPNPDTVRPLPVLQKALDLLKKKWKQEGNYTYICDQFKSLRQDLTVQHIRNEFTVVVYEIHARIALEKGDLGEYNQCQTQLRVLYKQKLGGHPTEFKAYRILYFIYTRNWTAMNDALADVTAEDKKTNAVKHALEVRSALALGNYHRFFQLYLDTPNMGAYLMDMFVDRERLTALASICRAYKPDVNIRFITEELGFESDEQTARFILDHSAENTLEEKNGTVRLLTSKAGPLFEQAKAEAHRVVDIKGQI
ncbi:SAC3/GANP domain protein [Penicillium brasilianum]|uniref:SAC3/GANP domain protein n=1 Tax=Penicillium brasilianum TaxID=104259 RepID=A0A1S9RSP2_PENBI|nr:SAC3/GANP domain protein [Penicillium brasilianum]